MASNVYKKQLNANDALRTSAHPIVLTLILDVANTETQVATTLMLGNKQLGQAPLYIPPEMRDAIDKYVPSEVRVDG